MDLEEQIEKGKELIGRGKSLGKDTLSLEERVMALEIQLKEHRNGEPERKKDWVRIMYSKRNLRIEAPDIGRLFLEIKPFFPKGSIVVHNGCIYIAFYYLPFLLQTMQQKRFGSVDIDSTIPDAEIVLRSLDLELVSVKADLAAELENPVTKALLERKSPQEVSEITRQLQTELRRSRWIDSIWEAVEKAKATIDVMKEEEFDMNNESKMVDNRLKETSDVFLANGKTSLHYVEKGGDKEMSFDIDVEDPIEAGVCELIISKLDTKESKFGTTLQVGFKLEDGRSLNNLFPLPAKLSNKTGQLIKKALGEFKKTNSDELVGKKVKALVEHVQRDGRTYVNVSKIL